MALSAILGISFSRWYDPSFFNLDCDHSSIGADADNTKMVAIVEGVTDADDTSPAAITVAITESVLVLGPSP